MKETLPPLPLRAASDTLVAGLIFAGTLLIFWFSPLYQVSDSSYSMLLSQSLLEHRSFMLDHYAIPRLAPVAADNTYKNGEIYQVEWVGNHLYYFFPTGSSVLSVPYVALAKAFGVSAANADGSYNARGEVKIETGLAALLMALAAAIFFCISRLVLSFFWSILIALGSGLGTQLWSTASRGLWSHTWATFLMTLAVFLLLAAQTGKRQLSPIVLATLLSWAYFVRPTTNAAIIGITAYVFVCYRGSFRRYLTTGALWLLAFVAYSLYLYGHLLPSYYSANRLTFSVMLPALLGHLVSPSRGLFIYVPIFAFIVYLVVRFRPWIVRRQLLWLSAFVVLAHLLLISSFVHWWGGFCYGARLTTDLVPWFVLLAILGVEAMLNWREQGTTRGAPAKIQSGVAALLLATSVFINGRGAIARQTETWNVVPLDVDSHPERLWVWRDPQMLAGLVRPPVPAEFPLLSQRIDFSSPESGEYLWYGWSAPEQEIRWTEGKEAAIVFRLPELSEKLLQMKLIPFLVEGKHGEQRLDLALNGRHLETLVLTGNELRVYDLVLPREALQQKNILTLGLPDAVSPKSLKVNDDVRELGIAVSSMSLQDHNGLTQR